MDGSLIAIVIVTCIIAFVFAIISWTLSRSRGILDKWASRYHLDVLDAHFCWFWRGPFFWRSSKGQAVYRVTVSDPGGTTRQGWVRCGSFWLGIWSDQADVRWD